MTRAWLALGQAGLLDPEVEAKSRAMGVPLMLGMLVGAFVGLLAGMVLARMVHFGFYLAGREYEARSLVIVGIVFGALTGAWLVLYR